MKKLFALFALLCVVFVSCNNEDDMVIINAESIKSELAALPSPEKQEFINAITSLSSVSKLRSASISLIEVFPLAEVTFEVFETYAIKKFAYYELSNQSERIELLTMMQQFQIVDGKLDTSGYSIEYEIGIKDSRFFEINTSASILEVTCLFHFNNGNQFAYRTFNGYSNEIKLPNIANGKWEIILKTDDGDMTRVQTTGFIDYSYWNNQLTLVSQPKAANVVAKFAINKEMLKDVYQVKFIGEDPETGEEIWIYVPFFYSKPLPNTLFFDLPFFPIFVVLISDNYWDEYWIQDNWTQTPGQLPQYFININD